MPGDGWDSVPIDPHDDVAWGLYHKKEFDSLPDSTGRKTFDEIIYEVWKALLYEYAKGDNRSEPNRRDAVRAVERLKSHLKSHLLTRGLPSPPGSLREWFWHMWDVYPARDVWRALAAVIAGMAAVFGAGFAAGKLF